MGNTKAVLIIGGSGFIGTHLALRLREGYKVFATYNEHRCRIRGVTFFPFNVENRNWGKRIVYTAQPDVIVYAAGKNDPVWAEANPRYTEHIHTGGPATVSSVADILQPKFIFLSNPYAFDGTRGNYHESDIVLPNTALGKGKVGGENFIRGKSLNYVIARASPLFGRGNGTTLSFFDHLRMKLAKGEKVEAQAEELHSFAPVEGFVELIAKIIDSGMRNKVIHYSGLTKLTHYDFAKIFAKRFNYDESLIFPTRNATRKSAENEPLLDYSLNCSLAAETLKIKPLLLEQSFDLVQKKLIP